MTGIALLDLLAARRAARRSQETGEGLLEAVRAVTIRKSPDEVYAFWRRLERFPEFMAHLESVEVLDEKRSRWRVNAPMRSIEWTAEVVEDRPGEVIAWRTEPGSDIDLRGRVTFKRAPRDQGTEVTARVQYSAPGGPAGTAVARLLGRDAGQQIGDNLRRLKQVLEAGEVVRSDASPWGVDRAKQRMQRPGQPPSVEEMREDGLSPVPLRRTPAMSEEHRIGVS